MAVEKVKIVAYTNDEVKDAGFIGETYSYPNEFHEASGDAEAMRQEVVGANTDPIGIEPAPDLGATDKGAVVNGPNKNSPKPTGGTSGPGANTSTSNDDK